MMRTCLAACAALIIGIGVAVAAQPDSRRLSQAKDYIADEQWVRAIDALRAAVADPAEKNRDEALFWLAHSEHQAGDLAAAVETLARLEREFPSSRWVRPGRSLRVEIAQQLRRDDVLWWVAAPAPPVPPAPPVAPPARPAPVRPVPPPLPEASGVPPRPPVAPAAVTPETPAPPPLPPMPPGAWVPAPFAPDTDLRIQALGSLIQTHPSEVIPLLKEIALDSRDPADGRRAVFVLAQSRRPEARSTVAEVAKRGPEPVRIAAVRELGRFGGADAGSELLQVYSVATPRVKREVVSSLAALGTGPTTDALVRIARTEADLQVRNIAIVTLARTKEASQLRALYDQAPPESRRAVLAALFAARDEEELIRIASTERDTALRQEARRQLRLLGTPRALQFLDQHDR
jgi:HEAT repeat protein